METTGRSTRGKAVGSLGTAQGRSLQCFPSFILRLSSAFPRGNIAHVAAQEACNCPHGGFLLVSVGAPEQVPTAHRLSQALLSKILVTSFGNCPDK